MLGNGRKVDRREFEFRRCNREYQESHRGLSSMKFRRRLQNATVRVLCCWSCLLGVSRTGVRPTPQLCLTRFSEESLLSWLYPNPETFNPSFHLPLGLVRSRWIVPMFITYRCRGNGRRTDRNAWRVIGGSGARALLMPSRSSIGSIHEC